MGLLPDTENCGLRKRWEYREHFPRHRLQRKPLDNDPCMHHGTCVTHTPWSMSGSLTRVGGENVPGIPRACAPRNFTYLVRSPWNLVRVLHNYLRYPHNTKGQLWECVYLSCANSNLKSSKIKHTTTKICQSSSDRMFVSRQTSIAITWLPHTAGVSCDL